VGCPTRALRSRFVTALLALLILAAAALIPGTIAQRKGRRFWLWWLFGVVFFVPAMVASALVSNKHSGNATEREREAAEKALYELHESRRRAGR
jgi:4-amino-4-deoxy-L-arabinose transferase-like glycosyltransferase